MCFVSAAETSDWLVLRGFLLFLSSAPLASFRFAFYSLTSLLCNATAKATRFHTPWREGARPPPRQWDPLVLFSPKMKGCSWKVKPDIVLSKPVRHAALRIAVEAVAGFGLYQNQRRPEKTEHGMRCTKSGDLPCGFKVSSGGFRNVQMFLDNNSYHPCLYL